MVSLSNHENPKYYILRQAQDDNFQSLLDFLYNLIIAYFFFRRSKTKKGGMGEEKIPLRPRSRLASEVLPCILHKIFPIAKYQPEALTTLTRETRARAQ